MDSNDEATLDRLSDQQCFDLLKEAWGEPGLWRVKEMLSKITVSEVIELMRKATPENMPEPVRRVQDRAVRHLASMLAPTN